MTDDIRAPRPKFCDDWSCPARVSCKHHFGRSAEYNTMKRADREGNPTGHGAGTWYWRGIKECCAKYEFDVIKEWLKPKPGQVTHLPNGSAW